MKLVLKSYDIARGWADGDVKKVLVRVPLDGSIDAQVTAKTPGIINHWTRNGSSHAVHGRSYRPKVDGPVLERAAIYTASTNTRGDIDETCGESSVVLKEGSIATHTSVTAIEEWTVEQVVLVFEPVPVLVSTLKTCVMIS